MPNLSIIPAAAVADARLSDVHVRVLAAIGTHTNRLGGNVWASVATLAKESNLSERTVQRSLAALIETGYIRKTERTGRTNLYDVLLDGVTVKSPHPRLSCVTLTIRRTIRRTIVRA
jgi:DNA-binding MarR family transcriptional regulator